MNIFLFVLILSNLHITYSQNFLCKMSTSRDFFDSTYINQGGNLVEQANDIFGNTSVAKTIIFNSYSNVPQDENETCVGSSTGSFVCTQGTSGQTTCSKERQCQPVWTPDTGRLDFEKSLKSCSTLVQGESSCCLFKTVGSESYTLLNETAADYRELDCLSPCVYTREDQPGSRFCFKTGTLPVTCTDNNYFLFISITNKLSQSANGNIIGKDYSIPYFLHPGQTKLFLVKELPVSITAVQSGQTCTTLNNPAGFCFGIAGDMDCSVQSVPCQ